MSIVTAFAEAFNRQDVNGLLACFTPDATYADAFYGRHAGQPALRAMFERMFREGRDYRWTMETVVASPRRAASGGLAVALRSRGRARPAQPHRRRTRIQ